MATGDFSRIFGEVQVPPLPAAAVRASSLCGQDEVDFGEIARCIETDAGLAAAVLRLANSAAYGSRVQTVEIRSAVTSLGLRVLRNLSLGWAAMQAVPTPSSGALDLSRFWACSVLRALTARALATEIAARDESAAFTGALLADAAIPTLLHQWAEFYEPVVVRWQREGAVLVELEDEAFRWNHAQAAAWITRSWSLPDELVCAVGFHHATAAELRELELVETPVAAVALASTFEDELRPKASELDLVARDMDDLYSTDRARIVELLVSVDEEFDQVAAAFGVQSPPRITLADVASPDTEAA